MTGAWHRRQRHTPAARGQRRAAAVQHIMRHVTVWYTPAAQAGLHAGLKYFFYLRNRHSPNFPEGEGKLGDVCARFGWLSALARGTNACRTGADSRHGKLLQVLVILHGLAPDCMLTPATHTRPMRSPRQLGLQCVAPGG